MDAIGIGGMDYQCRLASQSSTYFQAGTVATDRRLRNQIEDLERMDAYARAGEKSGTLLLHGSCHDLPRIGGWRINPETNQVETGRTSASDQIAGRSVRQCQTV